MKLPDFIEFAPLNSLRQHMGASLPDSFAFGISESKLTLAELEIMSKEGLDISSLDDIRILPDGTLAYKDSRILLHIRDVSIYRGRAADDEYLPKFHLSNCVTLKKMRANNRFDRYVVSVRIDGKFDMNFIDGQRRRSSLKELSVCKYCLRGLSYKGYGSTFNTKRNEEIFRAFSIAEFFELFPRLIVETPKYTSATAPINDYPVNWKNISEEYRQMQNYVCENSSCKVDLSKAEHRRFLHVHHKNGLKHDCSASNLEALCIYCHAETFHHQHLKAKPDYQEFLVIKPQLRRLG